MALESWQIVAFLSGLHLFRGIEEERLKWIAGQMTELRLREEELVYEEGQEPNYLYFIFEGRVQMTRYRRGAPEQEEMLGFLDQGDYFGLEVLEARAARRTSVQTTTAVVLLCFSPEALNEVFAQVPELIPRLDLMIASFHLRLRTNLAWVNPEEYILYIARKHSFFLWTRLVPLIFLSIIVVGLFLGLYGTLGLSLFLILMMGALVVAGGVGLWIYVDWSNDYYIVTARRIVFQERIVLLYDSRQESPMEQVQSTEVDRSYLGQLLGFGDVRIRTYTGVIVFQAVRLPEEVEKIVQEQIKRMQSALRQAEIRSIEETIARRIGLLPSRSGPPREAAPARPAPTPMQRFMADLFHLRYEYGDTIQYRTHWWILISRIWLVSVLLLGVVFSSLFLLVKTALGQMPEGFPVVGAFLGLMLLGLGFFLWWAYIYLDWHNDRYLITSDQVVDINRKPLGKEERRAAPIRNILSVEFKRLGIIGLLLNFGTVYIRIGDTLFTFDNVYNPSEVQRELFHRMAVRSVRERQQQAEAERQRMADWISAYDRLTRR